jgi:hypothetical protein
MAGRVNKPIKLSEKVQQFVNEEGMIPGSAPHFSCLSIKGLDQSCAVRAVEKIFSSHEKYLARKCNWNYLIFLTPCIYSIINIHY